jgi:hypothetical protein
MVDIICVAKLLAAPKRALYSINLMYLLVLAISSFVCGVMEGSRWAYIKLGIMRDRGKSFSRIRDIPNPPPQDFRCIENIF